jgi:DNA invertase Pin-like site-specific DNA recombinase
VLADAVLSIGGSVHDPTDPVGRLLFNVLAMVAEFEQHASSFGAASSTPR